MIQITDWRRLAAFVAIIVIVIGGIIFWLAWGSSTIQRSGTMTVAEGTAAQTLWAEFVAEGYTSRTLPWKYHAWRLAAAQSVQAGQYRIEAGEKVRAVIERLVVGDISPDELSITYPEGFTLQQMAARTANNNIGTEQAFIGAAQPGSYDDQYSYLADIPSNRDLEGYLFPDTYRVFEDDTPSDVIRRMLTTFDEKFSSQLRQEATAQGRTLDEIIIMASIIEREVLSDEDMAIVSGVLWKRVDDGAGIDADATVRYALNEWEEPLTVLDLQVDSPYNTRRYRGLPPGPISNPGLRAIVAAVRPEASNFYYYLSAPSGETIFSRTNDEHNANKVKHLR